MDRDCLARRHPDFRRVLGCQLVCRHRCSSDKFAIELARVELKDPLDLWLTHIIVSCIPYDV